jgi:polyphosphate glucokinase
MGNTQWKRTVKRVVQQILPIWNPHRLYLGGGNATKLKMKLPGNVVIIPNVSGILGGIRLWEDEGH